MKFGPKVQRKKGLIVTIIVLGIVLVVVGAVVIAKQKNQTSTPPKSDSSKTTTPSKETAAVTDENGEASSSTGTTAPLADPETLASVDIAPLSITVFYSKGTPGFEYTVLKTADKTEYVQFTSTDLVGSKCTNDDGAFASIIKNPSSNETPTTSQTVKVGADTYGLSLASTGCTANSDLLAQYQTGFKEGFSSLKALEVPVTQ